MIRYLFVGCACVSGVLCSDGELQQAVQRTRGALREQGFKTDLADFNFCISDAQRARAAALTNADRSLASVRGSSEAQRAALQGMRLEVFETVGPNSVAVA